MTRAPALLAILPAPEELREQGAARGPKGGVPLSVQPFSGPLKFMLMREWVRSLAAYLGLAEDEEVLFADSGKQAPPKRGAADAGAAGAAGGAAGTRGAVRVVASAGELQEHCYEAAGICVLALLDGRSSVSAPGGGGLGVKGKALLDKGSSVSAAGRRTQTLVTTHRSAAA